MRFDAISKYQHNFIKKDFMFDYKYLLNSLCKNNEGFDAFDYFIKSILRYFSLQAGFVIRIDNENININSKNLSKEKIIKDIKVYRKLIENKKTIASNKKIFDYNYSIFIPISLKNINYIFAFFNNAFQFDKKYYYEINKKIIKFLNLLSTINKKIILKNLFELSNNFNENYNKFLINISYESMFREYLKSLNASLNSLISCACYKETQGNLDSKLVSFYSSDNLSSINTSIKNKILDDILSSSKSLKEIKSIYNDDKTRFIIGVRICINEVLSYIFLFEFNKNYIYFTSDIIIKRLISHLNILVSVLRNKKQETNFGKQVSLSYLASGSVHYINNYIQGITSRLELIKMYIPENSKINEQITKILLSTQDVKAFFNNYFLLINNQNSNVSKISFTDFIYDIFSKFQMSFGDVIDLEIDNLDMKYYVKGNEEYLFQAIWNILLNAYEFSDEDNVNIKLNLEYFYNKNQNSSNFLRLTIDDIGRGMSEEVSLKAIEPFFSTKSIDKRTRISPNLDGLGLTISRAIVSSYGGFIDIITLKNRGTRVKIILPIFS